MEEVRASMWEEDGRWCGRLVGGDALPAATREDCLRELRRAAGPRATLTVEVESRLVGVAEAAAVLGWDKRRIFTYLGRGSFPAPVAELASGRVWRRDDVEAFARTRTRRRAVPRGDGVSPDHASTRRRLFLVRHGRVDFDARDRFRESPRGRQWDPPLGEEGRTQAGHLATRLLAMRRPAAVYVSPFLRCRQTVEPYVGATGIEPQTDEDLGEVFIGEWEGVPFEEILSGSEEVARRAREFEGMFSVAPGGESAAELRARVVPAIDGMLDRHPDGDVVVIAHGGVVNAYAGHVLGVDHDMFFMPENTSISTFDLDGGRPSVRFLNDVLHLFQPGLFAPPAGGERPD